LGRVVSPQKFLPHREKTVPTIKNAQMLVGIIHLNLSGMLPEHHKGLPSRLQTEIDSLADSIRDENGANDIGSLTGKITLGKRADDIYDRLKRLAIHYNLAYTDDFTAPR
jgi:hypothetical protein